MADETRLGANFAIDTTDLKAGLAQANRLIRESESEFKAAAAGMDDWTQSEDGLSAKIKSLNSVTDIQRKKVNALQSEYDRLVAEGLDPASRQATELRTQINNETTALKKNEAELKKQTDALENLGKESKEAGNSLEGLKAVGGAAVGAVAAVGAACVAAVGSFLSLAESTREARTAMAKLETSFTQAGLTAEDAAGTFTELYSILGDEGKATESAAFLAQYADNEEELAKQTRILTGVFATYGDSIPTEGLAEGISATIAMGETQGVLADALEWQGVNLDEFNASLAACADEQEREALITETLTGLYGESADKYKEVNADVIASQKAQAELNETLNELGAIAEPIMTTLKTLSTELLQSITPFVSLIGEGLKGALEGADGAADMLAEGLSGVISTALDKIVSIAPFAIETITSIVPKLLTSILSQLPTILQTLLSMVSQVATSLGSMLPTLIPVIIDAVIMCAETLLDNIDMIIDAGISLLVGLADGLISALPRLIDKIPVIIDKAVEAITRNLPKLIQAGIELTVKLGEGLIKAIPQLASKIPEIVASIVKGLKSAIPQLIKAGGDLLAGLFKGLLDPKAIGKAVKGLFNGIVGGVKEIFDINSPSKVMADQVGKNLALGIGEGFEQNISAVNDDITSAMEFDDARISATSRGGFGLSRGGTVINYTNNFKQAYTSQKERYKAQQQLLATVRLAKVGG